MKHTNKLTVPDLISTGVFTALYFMLVAVATFSSVVIFPGFNNVVLPAFYALISGSVYMLLVAKEETGCNDCDCGTSPGVAFGCGRQVLLF